MIWKYIVPFDKGYLNYSAVLIVAPRGGYQRIFFFQAFVFLFHFLELLLQYSCFSIR